MGIFPPRIAVTKHVQNIYVEVNWLKIELVPKWHGFKMKVIGLASEVFFLWRNRVKRNPNVKKLKKYSSIVAETPRKLLEYPSNCKGKINMKFLLLTCAILFTLIGCATVTEKSETPDHKKIYGIDCSGKAVSIQTCYNKAAKLCPSGYVKLSDEAAYVGRDPVTELTMSIPGVRKGVTIQCK